jgi:hypothetical protein
MLVDGKWISKWQPVETVADATRGDVAALHSNPSQPALRL